MAKSDDSKRTIAAGSLLVPFISRRLPLPPGVLAPRPSKRTKRQTLVAISLPVQQVQPLYELLSKEGKPRLVPQGGETALELPDAVRELLLKVVGGTQQGKAISIEVR
jgi:hypothetical protein